jgi:uncharacterized protein YbjQ (UPF0145 family)
MASKCKKCGEKIGFFSTIEVGNQQYCFDCSKIVEAHIAATREKRESLPLEDVEKVLSVTTQQVHGYEIIEHIGIVNAQVILGVVAWKDLFGSFRSWAGGRAVSLEEELRSGFQIANTELKREAYLVGANAVLAAEFDGGMEVAGDQGVNDKMMVISASGTAVRIAKISKED